MERSELAEVLKPAGARTARECELASDFKKGGAKRSPAVADKRRGATLVNFINFAFLSLARLTDNLLYRPRRNGTEVF